MGDTSAFKPPQVEPTSPASPNVLEFAVLVLFSGPKEKATGIDTYLLNLGATRVEMVDTCNSSAVPMNLSSDHTWEYWLQRLHEFHFVLMEPVCSSFSPARRHVLSHRDNGPRVLRNRAEPYGIKHPGTPYTSSELDTIKLGNLYGRRCLLFARAARALGISSAIESPQLIYDDQASIFLFDEALALKSSGSFEICFDQCMYEAESTKPTCLLVTLSDTGQTSRHVWESLTSRCNHRKLPWYTSAHPPIVGKQGDRFKTSSAQVYPPKLNVALAKAIWATKPSVSSAKVQSSKRLKLEPSQTPAISVALALDPQGRSSLLKRSRASRENEAALGGMRSPAISVLQLPTAIIVGSKIGEALRSVVEHSDLPDLTSSEDIDPSRYSQQLVDSCIAAIASIAGPTPSWTHSVSPVRGDLLWTLTSALGDPDYEVANWFKQDVGTPMGLEQTMTHTGIFPKVPDDRVPFTNTLDFDDSWQNYQSAESSPDAVKAQLGSMVEQGWCREFDSLDQLAEALNGATPIFSKLGLISKLRDDGTYKHRLIWDLLRSKVNASATQSERIILPRLIDLVNDILDLIAASSNDEEVWIFIIDIQNAFHLLPLRNDERRYFCTSAYNKLQLYLVMLFGPKAAPSSWGRFAALVSRLTQAIVGTKKSRLQFYVDDPACAVLGTRHTRSVTIHVILLLWTALGIPLAWTKAQYAQSIVWIGACCTITQATVETSITAAKLEKARSQALKLMASKSALKRDLASFAGVMGHFAGIVPTLWPFIRPLWAVLYDTSETSLPSHKFHTSRIMVTVAWFMAFLQDPARLLTRPYSLSTPPLQDPSWLRVSVDASPWGMGGVKWDDNWLPIEYFHTVISTEDQNLLGIKIGESAYMPVLEALAILISIRLWASNQEVAYACRSDALGAIQAMANLRSPNPGVNRVAAELALDIVDKQYAPIRITHIPGVSNVLPDYLSRLIQPGSANPAPRELAAAVRRHTPVRDIAWWRTLKFESLLQDTWAKTN